MSISYHGVIGAKHKVTLPSVDSVNILRDPPKSIHTRKIDKVGDRSDIVQTIQESGDRVNESIKVYARGINPMVAVNFTNAGTNGGQYRGGQSNSYTKGSSAFLPYRTDIQGAFRPPTRAPESLLPLSRQPRIWTSAFSQPGFADFSQKALCPGSSQGTKETQSIPVIPNAVYKLETPIIEPYEVKYVIKNPLPVPTHSGYQPQGRFNGEIAEPSYQVHSDPLRPDVHMNINDIPKNIELSHFDTENYTHETLQGEMYSNISRNIATTSIEDLYRVNTDPNTKNATHITYTAPHTSYDKYDYITTTVDLERSLPQYDAYTNVGQNIHKRLDNQVSEREYIPNRPMVSASSSISGGTLQKHDQNRDYSLKPTISAGGFDPVPTMPTYNTGQGEIIVDSEKVKMRQRVYDMQQGRTEIYAH